MPELLVGAPKEYVVPDFSFLLAAECVEVEAPGVPVVCLGWPALLCKVGHILFDDICACVIPVCRPICV